MIVTILSNLHGNLPKDLKETDLLIIVGSLSPATKQSNIAIMNEWMIHTFAEWITKQKAKEIVVVPGPHDFILDKNYHKKVNLMISTIGTIVGPRLSFLTNQGTSVEADKKASVYGLTTCKNNKPLDWAFSLTDQKELLKFYSKIPENTDILVCNEDIRDDVFLKVLAIRKPKLAITSNSYTSKKKLLKIMDTVILQSSYSEDKGFYEPFENVEIPVLKI